MEDKDIHVWLNDPEVVVPLRDKAKAEKRSIKGMAEVAIKEWLDRQKGGQAA